MCSERPASGYRQNSLLLDYNAALGPNLRRPGFDDRINGQDCWHTPGAPRG